MPQIALPPQLILVVGLTLAGLIYLMGVAMDMLAIIVWPAALLAMITIQVIPTHGWIKVAALFSLVFGAVVLGLTT